MSPAPTTTVGIFCRHFRKLFSGRYSWIANTMSGGILFIVGDTIEQKVEIIRGQHKWDWDRMQRIGIVGLFEGPTHHFFYNYLDKVLPGKTIITVCKKILVDQMVASPLFSVQFFVGMSLLEGQSLLNSWKEFTRKFPTVFMVDCMLWPPFQFFNFYLVPARYRVLYINLVTVVWNIFLSYMKHYDHYPVLPPKEVPKEVLNKLGESKSN